MGMECINGLMEAFIKEIGIKIKLMGTESITGTTVEFTKATG
jgi:hypothetical protein